MHTSSFRSPDRQRPAPRRSVPQRLVLPLALASFLVPLLLIEYAVMRHTGGTLCYPLDDTFIQMAIAKNLALYGNWGVSPHEFASASSSILYAALLGVLFKLFSINTVTPLLVNAAAAILLLIALQRRLKKEGLGPLQQLIILLTVSWLTPLPVIALIGMEHTLQCLFSLLFILRFADWMGKAPSAVPGRQYRRLPFSLIAYGMLTCAIRYEGLFLVGTACLMLLYRKQLLTALRLGLLSSLPLLFFGFYSLSKGSYFFPNSVLLKGGIPFSLGAWRILGDLFPSRLFLIGEGASIASTRGILVLLPLAFFLFRSRIRQSPPYGIVLGLLTFTAFLEVLLGKPSQAIFYRYEAWIICAAAYIVSLLVCKYSSDILEKARPSPLPAAFMGLILLSPFLFRASGAFRKAAPACRNIYDQQCQMGAFVHRYYDQDAVAVNDLGVVAYSMQVGKPLDLVGLGNNAVTRALANGMYSASFLDSLCRNEKSRIAIIYEQEMPKELYSRWEKIASWQIPGNVICTEDSVCFFATAPGAGIALKRNLVDFEPVLPQGITVRYTGQ